jgi:SNF2 family DNA or RNA helicase
VTETGAAPLVELAIDGDDVVVTGDDRLLSDRASRLYFRSVLGASQEGFGWRCPRRRLAAGTLLVRIFDWLTQRGFTVERSGVADDTIALELQRRVSFQRTRAAATALHAGEPFAYTAVDDALVSFGWSRERELREHQRQAVAHALTAANAANFSVPGAGKTATALAVAATHLHVGTIDLVVVVGPLACFDPWEQETRAAVDGRIATRRIRGSAAQRRQLYLNVRSGQLLLLSYATAAADAGELQQLFANHRVMLVVDESHRVKRFRGGVWASALMELAKRAHVRMILSGTPMPQSGRDLYSQLNLLWPDQQLTGTRDAFAARVDANFADVVRDVVPFVSRTPKERLGLQPYTITTYEVPLIGLQAEIYELIANRFRRELVDAATWADKLDTLRRGRPIRLLQAATNPDLFNLNDSYFRLPPLGDRSPTLMERLHRYRELEVPAKARAALELVQAIAERGRKVVVWSNFVANLDFFRHLAAQRLGIPCFQIDGRVPAGTDALHVDTSSPEEPPGDDDTREAIIHRFLDGEGPAMLVTNPASCSESISLHRSCHEAIYLDRTYDCALFLQSIDRIHRLGLRPDVDVNIHVLQATLDGRLTIDGLVDGALGRKAAQMRRLLEGAELAPINLADDPADDAEGDTDDLEELVRYLLGEST